MRTKLTDDERDELIALWEKWLSIGSSTEPADITNAEDAIRVAYTDGGIKPPERIVWKASPVQAAEYIRRKQVQGRTLGRPVWPQVFQQGWATIADTTRSVMTEAFHEAVKWVLLMPEFPSVRGMLPKRRWLPDLQRSHGCHSAEIMAKMEFFRDCLGIKAVKRMRGVMGVAEHAAWWWPFENVCVVSDRPEVFASDGFGLHCADGPAVSFRDGTSLYAWQGVAVPKKIITGEMTTEQIARMHNPIQRRCALEWYGTERFVRDSDAAKVHQDDFGELYRAPMRGEDFVAVKVVNATPERDGSFRDYFLRVPPTMKTAQQAVAWTFGFENDFVAYAPAIQT